jgi:hypothetical protein
MGKGHKPILLNDEVQSVRMNGTTLVRNVKGSLRKMLYKGKKCYVCGELLDGVQWIVSRPGGALERHYFHVPCWNKYYCDCNGEPLWPLEICSS